jgi:small subunit ribosomal protein S17
MAEKKTKKHDEKEKASNSPQMYLTRGRTFQGYVIKKFPRRVVVSQERTVYVHKYERFFKKKSAIHARLPEGMDVQLGDFIKVQECRPLSKIIHAIVIAKIRSVEETKK